MKSSVRLIRWSKWFGVVLCVLILVAYTLTLFGVRGWRGFDGWRKIIGLERGALYVYWAVEPPNGSASQFAADLAAFQTYPFVWWPARSSVGCIVPLWMPLLAAAIPTIFLWRLDRCHFRQQNETQ